MKALRQSLISHHQLKPVVVNKLKESVADCIYQVVDGNKTLHIARELKWDELWCKVVEVDGYDAMKIYLQLNTIKFQPEFVEMSEIITNLNEKYPIQSMANFLPFKFEEVKEIMKLKTFDWEKYVLQGETNADQYSLF